MITRALFREAIDAMEAGFRNLELQVPKPRIIKKGEGVTLRYVEQTIHQAILLKLARQVSGLNACDVLLASGYVQEQGVIQRTLDELDEDILFLCFGAQDGTVKLHRKYLKAFWQEEFEDGVAPIENTKGRYHIKRNEIREWLGRRLGTPDDAPEMKALRVVQQAYSGYVHAASPQIMDMCGGPQLRFHLRGLNGTPRIPEHIKDLWNYVYRGLLSANTVALVFGNADTAQKLRAMLTRFEELSGSSYMANATQADK
ncbi:hypothetical protein HF680_07300 [Brevundimonas sp. WCHBH090558]|uniref:hypothetical protein n=1 Tax=Brevundimonas huaxiensis TaxID=2725493 RepID=UPI0016294032|nr:hypothetical protein [Brevundimonas huaxiensis]MBC1182455.1 hypothetical protein [Brevundimonas huaxiensis]